MPKGATRSTRTAIVEWLNVTSGRDADPDFGLRSLRGTIVLRWEYRPGSMLYLVWTQRRADTTVLSDIRFWDDFDQTFRASGENIFLLKFSYRFEL